MPKKVTFTPAPHIEMPPSSAPPGMLGTAGPCWRVEAPRPPDEGVWEEVTSGPDDRGQYTTEFRPVPPPTRLTREERIAAYIMEHKDAPDAITARNVEEATGIPKSSVARSPAWKAFVAWRATGKVCELRTRQLTDAMLLNLPDRSVNDGADTLETLIASQEADSANDSYPPQYDDEDRG